MKRLLTSKGNMVNLTALSFGLIVAGLILRQHYSTSFGLIGLGIMLFMYLRFRG